MTKKIIYKKAPKYLEDAIFSSIPVKDFLPPPEKLIKKEKKVRVTINLNQNSINFFRIKAKKHGVPYQKMINKVLDIYVSEFSK